MVCQDKTHQRLNHGKDSLALIARGRWETTTYETKHEWRQMMENWTQTLLTNLEDPTTKGKEPGKVRKRILFNKSMVFQAVLCCVLKSGTQDSPQGLWRIDFHGKTPADNMKDPYILDFLGLPDFKQIHESKLESAIIDNLQSFLLELGKGFAFVARQKRIQYEDEFFYVDLVFYNCILKCYLLIDLKIGKLAHQDVGQIDSYVRMFDDLFITKDDNPTIGLILCSEKNESIARYSVLNESKQLFASKYMLYLPTEEELERELERERRLIEERQQAGDERDQDSD